MKKGACLFITIGMLFVGILVGCGSDSDTEKTKIEKDRIEKVGDAASSLGYDGKAIEEKLRGVEGLEEQRKKEMENVLEE